MAPCGSALQSALVRSSASRRVVVCIGAWWSALVRSGVRLRILVRRDIVWGMAMLRGTARQCVACVRRCFALACIKVRGGAWMCVVVSALRSVAVRDRAVRCIVVLQYDAACGGCITVREDVWRCMLCVVLPGDVWLFVAVHCGAWHC